ncbi:hypothetical protein D3C81_1893310 [compost metagenome]
MPAGRKTRVLGVEMMRSRVQAQADQGRTQAAEVQAVGPVGTGEVDQHCIALVGDLALFCEPILHGGRIGERMKRRSIAWNVQDNPWVAGLFDVQNIGRGITVDVQHRNTEVALR